MEEDMCRIRFYLDICCIDVTANSREDSNLAVYISY